MMLKLSLQEATTRVPELMMKGYHWGPSVLQVMWETAGLGNEDLLWSVINFIGGIAGQREGVCGAISAAAIYLGLRHRCPLNSKEQASRARTTAREQTRQLVLSFKEKHGDIICDKLTRSDSNDTEAIQRFRDSGESEHRCIGYVEFVIEKLYELETQWKTGGI